MSRESGPGAARTATGSPCRAPLSARTGFQGSTPLRQRVDEQLLDIARTACRLVRLAARFMSGAARDRLASEALRTFDELENLTYRPPIVADAVIDTVLANLDAAGGDR